MAVAPQPAILTFHGAGAFYLPVVLFALLAALAASFALPAVPIFSVSEFALLTPLCQLWSSFLSWFTPPCLFVILNGIIVTLSATSGMLSSSSASAAASPDFCPKLLSKVPSHLKQILDDPVEIQTYHVLPVRNLSAVMQERSVHNLSVTVSPLSTNESPVVFDERGAFHEEELQFYDAEDEAHTNSEVEFSHEFSRPGLESRSLTFCCRNHVMGEKEGDDGEKEGEDEHECNNNDLDDEHENNNDRDDEDASQDLMEKKVSLACREDAEFVQMTSRSVPSSPRFATPPKPNSIKRSLSVDSAPYPADQASTDFMSAESLSDEAFRKRVEDFISKMNAQLRKEVK